MDVSSPSVADIGETEQRVAAGGGRGTHFASDSDGRRRLFRSCYVRYWLPRFRATRRTRQL